MYYWKEAALGVTGVQSFHTSILHFFTLNFRKVSTQFLKKKLLWTKLCLLDNLS